MKADLDHFCRKLRLSEYFHKETENTEQESTLEPVESLVKKRGTFHPPLGRDKYLHYFIKQVQNYPVEQLLKAPKHNLTKDQHLQLQELRNDTSIIIKEADKGGGIVIKRLGSAKSRFMLFTIWA